MNETHQWFELTPVDAWFFGDGRPSNRGEDQSDLESLFPPHPTVVAGAFRAALARAKGWEGQGRWPDELNEVLGNGFENLGRLSFTGPFLKRDNELLFPMPRHVLGHTTNDNGKKRFEPKSLLAPSEKPLLRDQEGDEARLPEAPAHSGNSKPPDQAEEFFVTTTGMNCILQGELPEPDDCLHKSCLFRHEPRIGIERDEATLTTGENAMYSPHYVRLQKGVSLVTGINGLPTDDWQVAPLFPMGGESRMAHCKRRDNTPPFPAQSTPNGKVVLILLTPAYFANGPWWGAGPGDEASRLDQRVTGTVVTAAMDRPLRIGGWDSLKGRPLPLEPYAPPGTVWWLEDTGGASANGALLTLGSRKQYGFGLAALGAWPQPRK